MRSESRGQTCLHYAEPQGGKACKAGLMQNVGFKMQKFLLSLQKSVTHNCITSKNEVL